MGEGRNEKYVVSYKGICNLKYLRGDGRITSKCTLMKWGVRMWAGFRVRFDYYVQQTVTIFSHIFTSTALMSEWNVPLLNSGTL